MSPQTFIRDGCLTSTKLLSIQEDKRLNLFDTATLSQVQWHLACRAGVAGVG